MWVYVVVFAVSFEVVEVVFSAALACGVSL